MTTHRPASTWLGTLARMVVFGFAVDILYLGFAWTEDYPVASLVTWAISFGIMGLALFRRGPLSFLRRLAITLAGLLLALPILLLVLFLLFAIGGIFE